MAARKVLAGRGAARGALRGRRTGVHAIGRHGPPPGQGGAIHKVIKSLGRLCSPHAHLSSLLPSSRTARHPSPFGSSRPAHEDSRRRRSWLIASCSGPCAAAAAGSGADSSPPEDAMNMDAGGGPAPHIPTPGAPVARSASAADAAGESFGHATPSHRTTCLFCRSFFR